VLNNLKSKIAFKLGNFRFRMRTDCKVKLSVCSDSLGIFSYVKVAKFTIFAVTMQRLHPHGCKTFGTSSVRFFKLKRNERRMC
jgi:hypothetical protein